MGSPGSVAREPIPAHSGFPLRSRELGAASRGWQYNILVGHHEVSIDSLACEPMPAQAGFSFAQQRIGYRPVVGNARPWLVTKVWAQTHHVPRCAAGLCQ